MHARVHFLVPAHSSCSRSPCHRVMKLGTETHHSAYMYTVLTYLLPPRRRGEGVSCSSLVFARSSTFACRFNKATTSWWPSASAACNAVSNHETYDPPGPRQPCREPFAESPLPGVLCREDLAESPLSRALCREPFAESPLARVRARRDDLRWHLTCLRVRVRNCLEISMHMCIYIA